MAIAPVNKFVSIAVPVAPGLQKLHSHRRELQEAQGIQEI